MSSIMRTLSICTDELMYRDESVESMYQHKLMIIPEEEQAQQQEQEQAQQQSHQPRQKIMAPPMQYPLFNVTLESVFLHLDHLTQFDLASPAYLVRLKEMMRERHQTKPIIFGYIPAPPSESITKQVIGANGYFFKMTTTLCEAYFIWHDIENHMFLFWAASTFKIVKAMNSIRWRIVKCYDQANQQRQQEQQRQHAEQQAKQQYRSQGPEPDSDDDMPELISCGSVPDYEHPEPY